MIVQDNILNITEECNNVSELKKILRRKHCKVFDISPFEDLKYLCLDIDSMIIELINNKKLTLSYTELFW